MKYLTSLLVGAALLAIGAPSATAQDDEWQFNIHAGAFQRDLGFDEDDDTDTDVLAGIRLLRHTPSGFAFGGNFDWVFADKFELPEGFEDEDVNVNFFLYSFEIDYFLPMSSRTKFFLGAGIGGFTTQFDDLPDEFGDDTKTDLLVPLAAGLLFANDAYDPSWGLRIDARDNIQFIEEFDPVEEDFDKEAENNWELSAGLSFFFGGGPRYEEPEPVPDSDGDGVPDDRDRCPNTPLGTRVDAFGCPVPVDSDGDGVTDDRDRCPNTPAGTPVDADGCPIAEEPAACIDGRDWFRTDAAIFVDGRNYVKFGAPRTVAMEELDQVAEYDGVPVYVRGGAPRPYTEILLPFCAPANTYQAYRPEQEIRGTTG